MELARWTVDMDPPPVLEFHPDRLHFIEKLGEGPQGEVRNPSVRPSARVKYTKTRNAKVK